MEFKEPKPDQIKRGMNEVETIAFLEKHGIRKIPAEKLAGWRGPLLWVVEERVRRTTFGSYKPENIPSIVRIDNPSRITRFSSSLSDIHNAGGQVDYYYIDSMTQQLKFLRKSQSGVTYVVKNEALFYADDTVVPKS